MARVKLVLEDVQVESFVTEPGPTGAGTVRGLEDMAESGQHSFCHTHCPFGTCITVCETMCTEPNCTCLSSCNYTECSWEFTCDPGCGAVAEAG